jgi:hypothetical protein
MNAAAKITRLVVSPPSGPQGTTFTVNIQFQVINQTGTATLAYEVLPPDASFPFGDAGLLVSVKPGNYDAKFQFQATPSEDESFAPGKYQTIVELCEGMCGSTHEWTKVLAQSQTFFTITGSECMSEYLQKIQQTTPEVKFEQLK